MNLNTYDSINEKINKKATWIDVRKKQLISRELARRPYNCLLTRYNPQTNNREYYIAMLDNPPVDKQWKHTVVDCYGRIKIRLSNIWKEIYLSSLTDDCNINITLVEQEKDGDIYLLDI